MISSRLRGLYKCNFLFVYMTKGDPYQGDEEGAWDSGDNCRLDVTHTHTKCESWHNRRVCVCGSYETWRRPSISVKGVPATMKWPLARISKSKAQIFHPEGEQIWKYGKYFSMKNDNSAAIVVWRRDILSSDGDWMGLGLIYQPATATDIKSFGRNELC